MKHKIFIIFLMLTFFYQTSAIAKETAIDAKILEEQGYRFYKNEHYAKTIEYLTRIPHDKRSEEVILLIANSYESTGNDPYAISTLRTLIKKNPKNHLAYYNLGLLSYKNEEYNNAIGNLNYSIKLKKDFFPAYYNMGTIFYGTENYKLAYRFFKKAAKLEPENTDCYYNLIKTCEKLKKNGTAKKYQKILDKLSKN